ncbi:hypothetical protein SAMN05443665_1005145 [Actinomadura meyerae]|uniref:VOC domain-containing protein n=1 Tax=Actinomadura meyerae TaxID=240840 RepID=A0A239F3L2_9ACTN|nr:VOC family protein [Actinomadura meyerae]SNS51479.1 hypothetical protein SAMN05443665_1005145 [Actinomadura meyerae]
MSTDPAPLVTGITAALVGVSDFQPHLDLLCGELGFQVAAEGVVLAEDAARLWGAEAGRRDAEVMMLAAAGAATGRIHLLKVDDPVAPPEHPHTLDIGLAAIDIYTKDLHATHARLTEAGYRCGTPSTFEVPVGDITVTVTEGFCFGPDGTDLVFVQPASARATAAWETDPARHYTEVTSVVSHAPDFEAELGFWAALGMTAGYDVTFGSPGFEAMADLPPGTRTRLAFVAGEGGGTARIELVHVPDNPGGVDRRAAQRPGRALGHSGWSAVTPDLDGAVAAAESAGGRVRCRPFAASTPLHGDARLAMVDTPNGVGVELWQPTR